MAGMGNLGAMLMTLTYVGQTFLSAGNGRQECLPH
jgi:hypothetical protein